MEEEATERSVQLLLLLDPCNLKVFPVPFEIGQLTKSNFTPAIGIGLNAVSLKISLFTQFTFGSKADSVDKLASIALPITLVK